MPTTQEEEGHSWKVTVLAGAGRSSGVVAAAPTGTGSPRVGAPRRLQVWLVGICRRAMMTLYTRSTAMRTPG